MPNKTDFSNNYAISTTIPDGNWKIYLISKQQNYLYYQILIPAFLGFLLSGLFGILIYTFLKDKCSKISTLPEKTSEESIYKKIEITIDEKIYETVKERASTTNEIYIEVFKQIIPLLASLAMEQ